jgi:predicted unusual protein kinase regulating ubiquinone biosynthesis (AarF/ABC1/UbiB family)
LTACHAGTPLSRILEAPIDAPLRARLRAAMVALLDAFGCSMLRFGLFHADPHPGNLLLQVNSALLSGTISSWCPATLHDLLKPGQKLCKAPIAELEKIVNDACQEDGTLVLLDFGQCKALSAARQRALARLVIALDKGWPSGIVAAMKARPILCRFHALRQPACPWALMHSSMHAWRNAPETCPRLPKASLRGAP